MASNLTRLLSFGRKLASAQDESLRRSASAARAREQLLAAEEVAPDNRLWPAWARWSAVAAAVGTVAALALWPAHPRPMVFHVGPLDTAPRGVGERGIPGDWIAAPATGRLPVRFSDGSIIRLAAGSRARVVAITDEGAAVVLERGAAHADVVHRDGARWSVQAGPFDVHVRGTTFDVSWDPLHDMLAVTLAQGSVAITGCSLPRERIVAKGETFRAVCRDGELVMTDLARDKSLAVGQVAPPSPPGTTDAQPMQTPTTLAEPAVASAASPAGPPSAVAPAAPMESVAGRPSGVAPPSPRWRDLVSAGRYVEAMDAAEALDLSSLCASADVADLVELSDAARFAGRTDDAELLLRAIRRRSPDDERASVAAFHLGRIAFDNRRAFADAARWFETYLRERPQGAFSREASGRLIEALDRSGDQPGAKEAANRYLSSYPTGPHAEMARSVAGK